MSTLYKVEVQVVANDTKACVKRLRDAANMLERWNGGEFGHSDAWGNVSARTIHLPSDEKGWLKP